MPAATITVRTCSVRPKVTEGALILAGTTGRMAYRHLLRRAAALALVTITAGVGAVAAQAEDVYIATVPAGDILRMSTDNPSAAPATVATGLPVAFQGLVGTCTSLYAINGGKLVSVDPASGAHAELARLGGAPQGLVASGDGTRLWWLNVSDSQIYTRLVTDPASTASTSIATVTGVGMGSLLARVGDKLVVRNASNVGVLDASSSPNTTVTYTSTTPTSDRTYVAGNATRAFIEIGSAGSYTIKSFDPATQAAVDLATSAAGIGVMVAFDSNLWVFGAANTGAPANNNLWNVPVTESAASLALTASNKINGAELPGIVQAATRACPKAAAAAALAPAATVAPTVSGTTTIGSTLTGTNGTWSHDPTSYTYQWERCTVGNANSCTPIAGATRVTRLLQRGDVGKALRLAVTATNASGKATAHSALSAEVTAGSLKIFSTPGVSANPVLLLRVPGPGIVTLTGTRTVSSGTRAAAGDAACKKVVRKVTKGGLLRLICRPTAATQATRYAGGTVTVRLRAVYRPNKGAPQTATRVVVFRPLSSPEPVTG